MRTPFIYISEATSAQLLTGFTNEQGLIFREALGQHAIWAARVPFLPQLMSEDFQRRGSQERIQLLVERQARFIYDLARARDQMSTFELRFISRPEGVAGRPNPIEMVFLGKVFSTRPKMVRTFALNSWRRFCANFPLEDPFNFPLEPIVDEEQFFRVFMPIPIDSVQLQNIGEIRKHEDMPEASESVGALQPRVGDYIAHPLVPTRTFPPLNRFVETLSAQDQTCLVSISLRPTALSPQELQNIGFQIARFREIREKTTNLSDELIRIRAAIGQQLYETLLREKEHLLLYRISIVGVDTLPIAVVETLGSEIMDNGQNAFPTRWSLVQPESEDEFQIALNNLLWLEHNFWGSSLAAPQLQRLRYVVSPEEASGAFRLPIPPESGYMPGILIKNEPFVAPNDYLECEHQNARAVREVSLGTIYHRGRETAQTYSVPLSDLMRHGLIAGSTGAGKTTTIQAILVQLWTKYRIPFLVIYPVDKPDYRKLRLILGDDLLIFTLGDETTSPFRFNPFEVPNGLLIKTHLSRLMRAFSAAFSLFDPLPMIYRDALRRVYSAQGWSPAVDKGDSSRTYPIMSEFYEVIDQITNELRYGREVQDNVRQASVIRIGDLLENAGHAVNVRRSMPFSQIMQRPTIIEVGRVGSQMDTALLMGFLLLRLTAEIERRPRSQRQPYIMVVEEAHRLMSDASTVASSSGDNRFANPQAAAGEDFSNMLAEIRGFDVGIIIAEQMPSLLVRGAIGNTYVKIMHWLEDVSSFELFSDIMNLNPMQRDHARTLATGHAIVRSPFGRPVHVKISNPFAKLEGASEDVSDEEVKEFMGDVIKQLSIDTVEVEPWNVRLGVAHHNHTGNNQVASAILLAPMRTCSYCQPLINERRCPHRQAVSQTRSEALESDRREAISQALLLADTNERWTALGKIVESMKRAHGRGHVYCYFAHLTEEVLQLQGTDKESADRRRRYRNLLNEFEQHYGVRS